MPSLLGSRRLGYRSVGISNDDPENIDVLTRRIDSCLGSCHITAYMRASVFHECMWALSSYRLLGVFFTEHNGITIKSFFFFFFFFF